MIENIIEMYRIRKKHNRPGNEAADSYEACEPGEHTTNTMSITKSEILCIKLSFSLNLGLHK